MNCLCQNVYAGFSVAFALFGVNLDLFRTVYVMVKIAVVVSSIL